MTARAARAHTSRGIVSPGLTHDMPPLTDTLPRYNAALFSRNGYYTVPGSAPPADLFEETNKSFLKALNESETAQQEARGMLQRALAAEDTKSHPSNDGSDQDINPLTDQTRGSDSSWPTLDEYGYDEEEWDGPPPLNPEDTDFPQAPPHCLAQQLLNESAWRIRDAILWLKDKVDYPDYDIMKDQIYAGIKAELASGD
ncbi:hypothetical protein EWM64_g4649 [Hericium alpestre]|uniref:Uncharacterized protein n=1 Tax=Hericium alpestre TaxID=135208 RepID=A0A4Y9ZZ80_9AGAM|nr:hypothetical protein EWM64_g4649 [Hericium alpestre]